MSGLTRDGSAESVSRDQILRRCQGQENTVSPVQLLNVITTHTFICCPCTVCNVCVCSCVIIVNVCVFINRSGLKWTIKRAYAYSCLRQKCRFFGCLCRLDSYKIAFVRFRAVLNENDNFEIYEFPASPGVYRGVIILKTPIILKSNRAANFSKIRFRNLRMSKCFRSASLCFPWAGRRAPDYAVPTSRLL